MMIERFMKASVRGGLGLAMLPILVACASAPREDTAIEMPAAPPPFVDNSPTLTALPNPGVAPEKKVVPRTQRQAVMARYQEAITRATEPRLRAEALRRIADHALELADDSEAHNDPSKAGDLLKAGDYQVPVGIYQDILSQYPKADNNDRVLYQLGRVYEEMGEPDKALQMLSQLVSESPHSMYYDEVQFRRGELLFTARKYAESQQAYEAVLALGEKTAFFEKAQYKRGWTLFKQDQYDQALDGFFALLDRRIKQQTVADVMAYMRSMSTTDKELVDDTFRVASLSFAYMDGANSIEQFFSRYGPRGYEFLAYRHLADLYLSEERYYDAANTLSGFVRSRPEHLESPLFLAQVIEIYSKGNFPSMVLESKKHLVDRYGTSSPYWSQYDEHIRNQLTPILKTSITDLAEYYHARAQSENVPGEYEQAAQYYQRYIQSFPGDPNVPKFHFRMAELLVDEKRYVEAVDAFERMAYPRQERGADAGYNALLAYNEAVNGMTQDEQVVWRRRAIDSASRFVQGYPEDHRVSTVMTKAAQDLAAVGEYQRAEKMGQQVLSLQPAVLPDLRRSAMLVVSLSRFSLGAYDSAADSYQQLLVIVTEDDPQRSDFIERLALSLYRQAEKLRDGGDQRGAVNWFLQVGEKAPSASIRPLSEYDAAANLIVLKDWPKAIAVLETFRQRFPEHQLQSEAVQKLAVCYMESGQTLKAAQVFEVIASLNLEYEVRREALWQSADLYEKNNLPEQAMPIYVRYVDSYPTPLENAVEGCWRVANILMKNRQEDERKVWLQKLVDIEKSGSDRNDYTRTLASRSALVLAEPSYVAYVQVQLVEPFEESLKDKKLKMRTALEVYSRVVEYKVAETLTVAIYHMGEIYHELSRSMMGSQRPADLTGLELEQYDILLEEQSFPFEEKAIQIHEGNVQKIGQGVYDQWVEKSLKELNKLLPVRYAKGEKGESFVESVF